MADITGNTYDESKQRRKVILQRGKDVLDSELNEIQDIQRIFLRRQTSDMFGEGYILPTEFVGDADGTTANTVFVRAGGNQQLTYTAVADVAGSTQNHYILFSSHDTDYYAWANVGGLGVDPGVSGRTSIMVTYALNASAIVIAQAFQAAINAKTDNRGQIFSVPSTVTAAFVVTNVFPGFPNKPATAGNIGFGLSSTMVNAFGRFYVDGLRLSITQDVAVSGANYIAANPPSGNETHYLYVKITENEIDSVADPSILNTSLGSETTRRNVLALSFFVDYSVPSDTPADLHQGGTKYRQLAVINRTASSTITRSQVVDSRRPIAIGTMRDELRSFLVGGGNITWSLNTQTLSWASALKIRIPGKPFSFTIPAGSLANIAAGDVVYTTLNATGGNVTIRRAPNADVPTDEYTYPICMREVDDILFRDGALDLVGSGVSDTSGSLENQLAATLAYIGSPSITESHPNYPDHNIVAQGANLTTAIDTLDQAVTALLNVSPNESHQIVASDGQTVFNITGLMFDASNTVHDILVFYDGRKQGQSTDGLFDQPYKNYKKTSTSQLTFAAGLDGGEILSVYLVRPGAILNGGAITWSTPVNSNLVPDTGNAYDLGVPGFKFRDLYLSGKIYCAGGIDPTYIQLTPQVDDSLIPNNAIWVDSSDLYKVKLRNSLGVSQPLSEVTSSTLMVKVMQSGQGTDIPAGSPVAKLPNGKIVAADSWDAGGTAMKWIGIAAQLIPANGQGQVHTPGPNVVGALTGSGFTPGDEVFLDETAGTYTNDPSTLQARDNYVRVGIADCTAGVASSTVNDLIVFPRVVNA